MNLLFRQKRQQNKSEKNYTLRELQEKVKELLFEYAEVSARNIVIEEELLRNQEEHRQAISSCIRSCCSGNYGARETVLELIYDILSEQLVPDEEGIQRLVPFESAANMTPRQQLEAMIYFYDKQRENRGFEYLCKRFGWDRPGSIISEQSVARAYLELNPIFTTEDRRWIVTRILFAETVGLGVIDTLNQQKGYIEEIQVGMNGRTEGQYDYKESFLEKISESSFSRDGIHIMARGCTIWIKALSFGTEDELQRVLRNLIKDAGGGELTKKHPMLVVDTQDGRRISISRPPMTDTWIGLIRKFDTIQTVSLEKLYQDYPEEIILPGLLKQLVRSGRNIAITGEMASGKTTLFRACLAETKTDRNIRVIEADSFELNVRNFLPKANTVTMRVTEQTPAEEVLAFARKTTGQIFAIGEINSAAMATMAMDLAKIATQLLFSAHYISTEHMIADFVNAKLCIGGYSEEILAELDVVRCLGFDVHLRVKQGRRYVKYVNEIVPGGKKEFPEQRAYEVRTIYQYDEEKEQGVLVNIPSEISYERARQMLGKEEYLEFVRFFEK